MLDPRPLPTSLRRARTLHRTLALVLLGLVAGQPGARASANAAALRITGSGEFFRSGAPNSTLGMNVRLDENGGVSGRVSLHTSRRARLPKTVPPDQVNITHFDSEFLVTCLREVPQEDADVLEVVLAGVKTAGSQTSYVYRTTSDDHVYVSGAPIDTEGDWIFGRLRIDNRTGKVQRSDWTTGQEVCAGTSTSGLNAEAQALGLGVGDRSLAAFTQCEEPQMFLADAIQNLVPDCDDARVGTPGYEFSLDRALRPPNTVRFARAR